MKLINTAKIFGILVALGGNAGAALIYDASTANSTIITNAFAATGTNTLTGSTGSLVFTNTNGGNHSSGIGSTGDINTLNGSAVLPTDTVTLRLVVSSATGNMVANGMEFGLAPTATFRPTNHLLFAVDADGSASGMAAVGGTVAFGGTGGNADAAGWGVTEASMNDGFTITLTLDSSGFNFTISDIVEQGGANTSLSYGEAFSGTEFIDNIGTSHSYVTRQYNASGGSYNISEFSIDVTSVPEPSSSLLLAAGFAGFFLRRKR